LKLLKIAVGLIKLDWLIFFEVLLYLLCY